MTSDIQGESKSNFTNTINDTEFPINEIQNLTINEEESTDQSPMDQEEYSDEDLDEFIDADFMDSEFSHDISARGSGTLTHQYNRQKSLAQTNSAKPRFNPKGGSAPATALAAKELKEKIAAAKSASDEATLSKLMASRIKINDGYVGGDYHANASGTGGQLDRSNRATTEKVLDPRTRMILFKMINRGVVYEINGCISTGKEANVYHALTEDEQHRAIKIYKTSILVFKDRDKYVTGEFRFRSGYSKHNPRKMVKLWAEKEFRNLRRIGLNSDIPVPQPLFLQMHVLTMEFLGDKKGWPSPRLRDADHLINGVEEYQTLYYQLLSYMRLLYQQCRLVHADLSEYNILYHENKLWIIDVSQSVELEHPQSLNFLRMDIKNVTDFFNKKGCEISFSERTIFRFITTSDLYSTFFALKADEEHTEEEIAMSLYWKKKITSIGSIENETTPFLMELVEAIPAEDITEQDALDDAVFREVFIPRNLEDVLKNVHEADLDRKIGQKQLAFGDLVYESIKEKTNPFLKTDDDEEDYSEDGEENEDEENEDESSQNGGEHKGDRKFSDREANKLRKKQIKEQARAKREKKVKKHVKKKLNQAPATKHKK